MRYAIPLGAILLIGIASSLHRSRIRPALPERPRLVREPAPIEANPVDRPGGAGLRAFEPAISNVERARQPQAVGPAPASGMGWKKQLGTLERAVGLTAVQQPALEQLLRDREIEIRIYQASVRKAGILDIAEYEWRTGLMKETWYRQMDALLDGVQHDRFLTLLEHGFLNEGLEFTIDPGMTVLE